LYACANLELDLWELGDDPVVLAKEEVVDYRHSWANLIFVSKMHFLLSLWYLCDLLICAIIIVTAGKP